MNRYIKMSTEELEDELEEAKESLAESKKRAKITCNLVNVIDETIKIDKVVNSRLDYVDNVTN